MATVSNLIDGRVGVVSVSPETTVRDAAGLMNERRIGAVLVMDGEHLVGIFSERDVLRRVVAEGVDPATTPVGKVMTSEVVYCQPGATLDEVKSIFKRRRVRHLPVMEPGGKVLGVVSIGDVNAHDLDDSQAELTYLREYLFS
ncbi:MAG: CBS domain-containing protein [Planctomycetota bacterium]